MCFFLTGTPFVLYNRQVEFVNPLPKEKIQLRVYNMALCNSMPDKSISALATGSKSHFGKRASYSIFLKAWQTTFPNLICPVTFYSFLSSYTTKILTEKQQLNTKAYPQFDSRYELYYFVDTKNHVQHFLTLSLC